MQFDFLSFSSSQLVLLALYQNELLLSFEESLPKLSFPMRLNEFEAKTQPLSYICISNIVFGSQVKLNTQSSAKRFIFTSQLTSSCLPHKSGRVWVEFVDVVVCLLQDYLNCTSKCCFVCLFVYLLRWRTLATCNLQLSTYNLELATCNSQVAK